MSKKDEAWIVKHFPDKRARDMADQAIEPLDPKLPMTAYLDAWFIAYLKAGGKTKLKP